MRWWGESLSPQGRGISAGEPSRNHGISVEANVSLTLCTPLLGSLPDHSHHSTQPPPIQPTRPLPHATTPLLGFPSLVSSTPPPFSAQSVSAPLRSLPGRASRSVLCRRRAAPCSTGTLDMQRCVDPYQGHIHVTAVDALVMSPPRRCCCTRGTPPHSRVERRSSVAYQGADRPDVSSGSSHLNSSLHRTP